MDSPEFIVVGLDGGSWSFLDPWLNSGILPNLTEIRDNHHAGPLESCLPPVTSPNWKCYSTGRSPGQLGVYWWETLDWANETIATPSSGDYKGAELWDYLSEDGLESLVVNMPTTYPPPSIKGRLVSGGPTAGESSYTSPDSLEEELRQSYNYRTLPESIDFIQSDPERAIQEIRELMKLRFEVAEDQFEKQPSDFLQVTLYLINVLQHHFGHQDPVREAWQWIDRKIGEWRNEFPDTPLVLLSDHGCNEIHSQFNINQWLIQEEYLSAGSTVDQTVLSSIGLNKDRLARFLASVGLKKPLKSVLPKTIRNWLPTEDDSVMGPGKNRLIDWGATKAYAFGQGPVFVKPSLPEPDLSSVKTSLLEKLQTLSDPSGHPVASSIFTGSAYYGDHTEGTKPDLIIDQADNIHISNSIGFDQIFQQPDQWEAENEKMGLYAWVDPSGETILSDKDDTVQITDIMPSILAHMTGKIPEGIDGNVRFSKPNSEPPETIEPISEPSTQDAEEESTREKLEGLGYL
ncbi:MAG: alkaline phosphatase family protein [bacterium]